MTCVWPRSGGPVNSHNSVRIYSMNTIEDINHVRKALFAWLNKNDI